MKKMILGVLACAVLALPATAFAGPHYTFKVLNTKLGKVLKGGIPVYNSCDVDPGPAGGVAFVRGTFKVQGKKVAYGEINCYAFDGAKNGARHGPGGYWRIRFTRAAKNQLKTKRVVKGTLVIDREREYGEESQGWINLERLSVTLRKT